MQKFSVGGFYDNKKRQKSNGAYIEESDKEKAYEMFIGDFQRETDLRFDEVTIAQGGLVVLLVLLSKTLFCYSLYSILK